MSKNESDQIFTSNNTCLAVFYRTAALSFIFFLISSGLAFLSEAESAFPSYMEQLEAYRNHTSEHFRLEKEKEERYRRLEASVTMHTVKRGETLGEIARDYGVEVTALAYWNNISNPHFIREGAVLQVLTVEGTLHRVDRGDTLTTIASRYNVDRNTISDFNMLSENGRLTEGEKLVIPGSTTLAGKPDQELTTLALASRGETQTPVFHWPLAGTITSYYGWRDGGFHYGLDIAAPFGTEVRSVAAGVVDYTGVQRGYGLMLIMNHGNGWSSLYAHNSHLLVKKGQRVTTGQPVALVGASGNATGPHLHLEIIHYDRKLDPLPHLQ